MNSTAVRRLALISLGLLIGCSSNASGPSRSYDRRATHDREDRSSAQSFTESWRDAVSTFGLETDTASYTYARAAIEAGYLPQPDHVRAEEFVHYIESELVPPKRGDFAVSADLCPSPYGAPGAVMLRIGLRARDIDERERQPIALTLVLDTSGSMQSPERLPLVKQVVAELADRLDRMDQIAIVTYASTARVLVPPTRGDDLRRKLVDVDRLEGAGSTNVADGLTLGCELAEQAFRADAQNFVVLLSDGIGNVGETSADALLARTASLRRVGIHLNTVGVGMDVRDGFLERIADAGNGRCDYVDSRDEARAAFGDRFVGAFQVVAHDAKLQVEFDPRCVGRWRLIGYENRILADSDFRDARVDAGEIGAGHSVAALYELEDVASGRDAVLGTVRLRYRAASDGAIVEADWPIDAANRYSDAERAPSAMQAQIALAQFAELLAGSPYARTDGAQALCRDVRSLARRWRDPRFVEVAELVAKAAPMLERFADRPSTSEPHNEARVEVRGAHAAR